MTESILSDLKLFLESPLPKKLPKQSERLDITEITSEINPLPIPVNVKHLDVDEALAKTVEKDHSNPALRGIYHDSVAKAKITTDGRYLIVIPDADILQTELITPAGEVIKEHTFPKYREVIPFLEQYLVVNDPYALLNKLNGVARASQFVCGEIYARIAYSDHSVCVSASLLSIILRTFLGTGTKQLRIEVPKENERSLLIVRDVNTPQKMALLMGVFDKNTANEQPLFFVRY